MASISANGSRGHHKFTLNVTETGVDIANNISTISWSFVLSSLGGGYDWRYSSTVPVTYSLTIDGAVYSGNIMNYDGNSTVTIQSGSFVTGHNSDGTKTIHFSFGVSGLNLSYLPGTANSSGSMVLTNIPRQANITAAYDFTDVDNPSVSFSNPGGFPMRVWLEPNPNGDHLCQRTNIQNTGSYTWKLTDAERDELRSRCKGLNCTIRIGIYTTVNGIDYPDFKDKTFYMTENTATKPTVSISATLNNGTLPSKFNGMYIQGKSRLNVSISAQGKYSASISSYSANIGGQTYNSNSFLSNVISKEGKVDVIGYAKDSRQFTGSAKQQIEVTPYSKPLVIPIGSENAVLCYRSDGNGNRIGNGTSVWIKAKRFYYSLSSKNQCALQWRKKLTKNPWDDNNPEHEWKDLIPKTNTTDDAEYNALLTGDYAVFDETKSYTVQIRAIDDFGEYDLKTFEIPTEDVALHLGKGGKNVAVGTYCNYSEERTFYSDWKASFGKDVYFAKNIYMGGNKIVDFPIELGTSGIWTYKKWNSGEVELWGLATLNTFGDTRHIYVNSMLPFPFVGYPITVMSLYRAEAYTYRQGSIVLSSVYEAGKSTIRLSMIRNEGGLASGNTAEVNVHIKGKWK